MSWYCEDEFVDVQKFNIEKKETVIESKQFCLTQEIPMIVEGRSCFVQYTYIYKHASSAVSRHSDTEDIQNQPTYILMVLEQRSN